MNGQHGQPAIPNEQQPIPKTWDEFRSNGLLWLVNRSLTLLGWAIVLEIDDESEKAVASYPVRIDFRGFSEEVEARGFDALALHMKEVFSSKPDLPDTRLEQMSLNFHWVLGRIDDVHVALCRGQHGTWQQRAEQVVAAARAIGATKEVTPLLKWTDPAPPGKDCPYDHVIAETPFGRFLLTWKSWKDDPGYGFDETPWGETGYPGLNTIEEHKQWAEEQMRFRIAQYLGQ